MARPDDALFVALARKAGYPPEAQLRALRPLQLELWKQGRRVTLFELACQASVVDPELARRFERWAEQVQRREVGPLRESGEFMASQNPTLIPAATAPAPMAPAATVPAATAPAATAPAATAPTAARAPVAESAAQVADSVRACPWCGGLVEPGEACTSCMIQDPPALGAAPPATIATGTPGAAAPPAATAPGTPATTSPAPAPVAKAASPAPAPVAPAPVAPAAARPPAAPVAASPSRAPSGRTLLGTPSQRRLQAAQATTRPRANPVESSRRLVGGSVVGGVILLAAGFALFRSEPPAPEVALEPSPSPSPSLAPSPAVSDSLAPSAPPSPQASGGTPSERAARTAIEVRALTRAGHFRQALERVDAARAATTETDAASFLKDARERVVAGFREKLAEAKAAADDGDGPRARKLLARLRLETPDELESEVRSVEAAVATALEAPRPAATDKPEATDDPGPDFVPPPPSQTPAPGPRTPPAGETPTGGPGRTGGPRPPGGGTPSPEPGVKPSPDPKRSPRPEDEDDEPRVAATWMDDTSGSLPWSQAYVFETEHYVIKTSVSKKYIERYAALMEALANRYSSIFRAPGGDATTKNKLFLYGTEAQFHENEPGSESYAGFYLPGTRDLHCFHGPAGGRNGWAVGALAHESAHQFQHRAGSQIFEHTPTFFAEGLASFFEEPQFLPDGYVLVGGISTKYMESCRRAIKSERTIPLKELIRVKHADFGYTHYAHAWGLIHWLFYGPERKKSQKLLDWFWDNSVERKTTAEDFEEGVKAMGYTMPRLEKAWRDWVLALDPKKDPAVILYEQKTGKKVPR